VLYFTSEWHIQNPCTDLLQTPILSVLAAVFMRQSNMFKVHNHVCTHCLTK